MNVRPGGAQPLMHDTKWAGRTQTVVENGVTSVGGAGNQHGYPHSGPDMKIILSNHDDFRSEKTIFFWRGVIMYSFSLNFIAR